MGVVPYIGAAVGVLGWVVLLAFWLALAGRYGWRWLRNWMNRPEQPRKGQ